MKYVCKTYIEFLYPGSPYCNTSTHGVKTRDVPNVNVPENAFGFKFFDTLSTVIDVGNRNMQFTSERISVSPMYYYGGKVYTVEELKREIPNEHTIIRNIEGEGCKKAIKCRAGAWLPFKETDILIEAA